MNTCFDFENQLNQLIEQLTPTREEAEAVLKKAQENIQKDFADMDAEIHWLEVANGIFEGKFTNL